MKKKIDMNKLSVEILLLTFFSFGGVAFALECWSCDITKTEDQLEVKNMTYLDNFCSYAQDWGIRVNCTTSCFHYINHGYGKFKPFLNVVIENNIS